MLVEFSLILPVILVLLVGSIEIGGAVLTQHTLSKAARCGARVYTLKTKKNEADVYAAVGKVMESAGLKNYTVSIDPKPATEVEQLTPLTVTIAIDANQTVWSLGWFTRNLTISARCIMPADLGEFGGDSDGVGSGESSTEVYDVDDTGEGSGTTDKELEKLQKEALKAKNKAQKAQEDADKKAAKAAEKQAQADEAAKAAEEGDDAAKKAAAKAQEDADKAAAEAAEKQQRAYEAWQEYQNAMSLLP